MSENERPIYELARQATIKIVKKGLQQRVLDLLFDEIKTNTDEAVLEALLQHTNNVTQERDQTWLVNLSELLTKTFQPAPTNPAEMVKAINFCQMARERDLRRAVHDSAYEQGFKAALLKAGKLGWGSCEAGKGLDETLKAVEQLKP